MDQLVHTLNAAGAGFCRYAGAMFVQTTVLVAVLLVVDLFIRKRVRAALRYWMWMLVFVKLVLPPTLALPTGVGYWLKVETPRVEAAAEAPLPPPTTLERLLPATAPALPTYMPVDVASAADTSVESSTPVAPVADPAPALTWQAAVFVLWLVGLLVFGLLLVQRAFFVRGLVAQSIPAGEDLQTKLKRCAQQVGARSEVELRISPNTFSPAVCGLLRPTILIPASLLKRLSADNLRAVLIHELAHIKRGDLGMNFAQTILQVVYFYNPLIWLAGALVRKVREKAVDEMVLVALGAEAKSYSRTLIDIAEMTFFKANLALRLIGVAESKRSLEGRIKHMLTRPIPRTAKVGFWGVLALAAAGAVLLPMAQGQNMGTNPTVAMDSVEDKPATNATDVSARVTSAQNLSDLGKAMLVYANDYKGRLPDTLLDLIEVEMRPSAISWLQENVAYLGQGMTVDDDPGRPVAFDRTLLAQGQGTNVLYLDSHVAFETPEKLGRMGIESGPIDRTEAMSRLRQLALVLLLYAEDNDSRLPDSINAARQYFNDDAMLTWLQANAQYIGQRMQVSGAHPDRQAIAYMKTGPIATEGAGVAFLDGHVEFASPARLETLGIDTSPNGAASSVSPSEAAARRQSARYLGELGKASLVYAYDHSDRFPDSLSDLTEVDMAPHLIQWLRESVVYLGRGATTSDQPDRPLAYDKTLLAQGKGTNVLYLDSHVEFQTPEWLERLGIEPEMPRAQAGSYLRRLAIAAHMYADEHGGAFPDDMKGLEHYVGDESAFAWLEANAVYLGRGATSGDPSPERKPLAYWRAGPLASDGVGVVYVDGHVEFFVNSDALRDLGLGSAQATSMGPAEATARLASARNLAEMGKALLIYANDHHDRFPDDLKDLVIVDMPPALLPWLQENTIYLGRDMTVTDRPDRPLAYDKTLLAQGQGTNVLYLDSHVAFETPDRLERLGIRSTPGTALAARDWLEGFWITFVPHSPIRNLGEYQQVVRISFTSIRLPNEPAAVPVAELEIRRAADHVPVARVPFAASEQGRAPLATLMQQSVGTLPDGQYLAAFCLGNTRCSNVARLTIDSRYAPDSEPVLTLVPLPSPPNTNTMLVGIRAIGRNPADPELTNEAVAFAPVFVDGTERRPETMKWVGGIGPVQPDQQEVRILDLGQYAPAVDPGRAHRLRARIGGFESPSVIMLTTDDLGRQWDEATETLPPYVRRSAVPRDAASGVSGVAPRAQAAEKLAELGKALLIYAHDHDDQMPDSLEDAAEHIDMPGDLAWIRENVVYCGRNVNTHQPPDTVTAYDKTLLAQGNGTNVLYLDTHVAFKTPEQFEQLGIAQDTDRSAGLNERIQPGPLSETSGQDILEKMRSFDTTFLQASTIMVEGRSPVVEQQQISPGEKIETITVVLDGSGIAVDRRISFTETPAYREPTAITAGDYRPDGDLIVWRPMRERGLMRSAFQGYRSDLASILVSPSGEATRQSSSTSAIDLYRPDDPQRCSSLWNPVLATGRGFSQYLRDVVEAEEIEDGLVHVEARGVSHLGVELTWDLVVDPQADYLVRSASYTYAGGRFDFRSTGVKRFGSQVLAGQARLGSNLTMEIRDYRPKSDSEVLTAIQDAFRQPLPEGATVVNWTSGPASLSL